MLNVLVAFLRLASLSVLAKCDLVQEVLQSTHLWCPAHVAAMHYLFVNYHLPLSSCYLVECDQTVMRARCLHHLWVVRQEYWVIWFLVVCSVHAIIIPFCFVLSTRLHCVIVLVVPILSSSIHLLVSVLRQLALLHWQQARLPCLPTCPVHVAAAMRVI